MVVAVLFEDEPDTAADTPGTEPDPEELEAEADDEVSEAEAEEPEPELGLELERDDPPEMLKRPL